MTSPISCLLPEYELRLFKKLYIENKRGDIALWKSFGDDVLAVWNNIV